MIPMDALIDQYLPRAFPFLIAIGFAGALGMLDPVMAWLFR